MPPDGGAQGGELRVSLLLASLMGLMAPPPVDDVFAEPKPIEGGPIKPGSATIPQGRKSRSMHRGPRNHSPGTRQRRRRQRERRTGVRR